MLISLTPHLFMGSCYYYYYKLFFFLFDTIDYIKQLMLDWTLILSEVQITLSYFLAGDQIY